MPTVHSVYCIYVYLLIKVDNIQQNPITSQKLIISKCPEGCYNETNYSIQKHYTDEIGRQIKKTDRVTELKKQFLILIINISHNHVDFKSQIQRIKYKVYLVSN